MMNFFTFFIFLVLGSTIYSLRDYSVYAISYHKMKFMNFVKRGRILIANENTNEEFVIISDWNFCISPKRYLQFDIWTLIDLHKLYWIFKFTGRTRDMGLLDRLYKEKK